MARTIPSNARPKRRSGYAILRVDDQALMVDSEGRTVCALNSMAVALWELCDGETTVAEMTAAVCELCDVPEAVARHDLTEAIERFREQRLLR